MVTTISPQNLADLLREKKPLRLVDVRTPAEFGEVHVETATNVPLDRLDPATVGNLVAGEGPLYFICRSGGRSGKACEKMMAAGHADVISVDGGTAACETAGLPVIRGRKAMSLERQVRIAAGALVFAGVMLAAFGGTETLRLAGLGIAGFVGAGLVFAGVTDTCGMAMIIARMPWNQACGSAASCSRVLLLAAMLTATAGPALAASPTRDSLPAVQQAVAEQKAVIIDVREPDEWAESHLSGARLVPLSRLKAGVAPADLARMLPQDKIIYCHCLAGGRCLVAADILKRLGYDVRPLGQSYDELVSAGFPAVTGR
jgi:rhodanese-related sulfurtransferase